MAADTEATKKVDEPTVDKAVEDTDKAVKSTTETEDDDDEEEDDDVGESAEDEEMSVEEKTKKAADHFAAGKRHLVVGDLPAAVASLADACSLIAKVYGDTAPECADVYFHYGRACLELARVENNVLENVLDGVPDNSSQDGDSADDSMIGDPEKCSEEEKSTVSKQVSEAIVANTKSLEEKATASETSSGDTEEAKTKKQEADEKSSSTAASSDDAEKKDEAKVSESSGDAGKKKEKEGDPAATAISSGDAETKKQQQQQGESKSAKVNGKASDAEDDVVDDAEDEEPSNIQLAWEMFECAKLCVKKRIQNLKDAEKSDASAIAAAEELLTETFHALGEVSIENENYGQAVEDLTSALEQRQLKLPPDSRRIAETHYQLSLAAGYNCQFDDAVRSLKMAIDILQSRTVNLKANKATDDKGRVLNADQCSREIAEIEKLVPELRDEINDKEDMRADHAKRLRAQTAAILSPPSAFKDGGENGGTPESSKEGTDIMVKKRKKALPIVSSSRDAATEADEANDKENGAKDSVNRPLPEPQVNKKGGGEVAAEPGNPDQSLPAAKKAHLETQQATAAADAGVAH